MFLNIEGIVRREVRNYLEELGGINVSLPQIVVKRTDNQIDGDITLLIFSLAKQTGKSMEELSAALGERCLNRLSDVLESYVAIKGFLNFKVKDAYWLRFLSDNYTQAYWRADNKNKKIVVEFSSPNTNKPLHLGHLRNNFIGESVARMLVAAGYQTHKTCIVNDRGVHICKSMLAWRLFAHGATPQSEGKKGDHFVGDYYVLFEQALKKETEELRQKIETSSYEHIPIEASDKAAIEALRKKIDIEADDEKRSTMRAKLNEAIRNATPLMGQVRKMLREWEEGDPETIRLWRTMNEWVYAGFEETYKKIGTSFDSIDYESDCYLLGKSFVQQGLEEGIFYLKEDKSIWVDLSEFKLDQKLLLRKDQTSVYITQDLGLVQQRYEKYLFDECIYVVGNEQDHHFKVLRAIAQKMKRPYSDKIYHLSYGMVELPSGKMKSREGSVVDADELIDEMNAIAKQATVSLGKVEGLEERAIDDLSRQIGMAAIKFYLLRVHPTKTILFNPQESIDLHGFTGPFVQYTHARICSILKQCDEAVSYNYVEEEPFVLEPLEKKTIMHLEEFPQILEESAASHDPSILANYAFQLAKKFNSFYTMHSILKAESSAQRNMRLALAAMTRACLKEVLFILGIDAPHRM